MYVGHTNNLQNREWYHKYDFKRGSGFVNTDILTQYTVGEYSTKKVATDVEQRLTEYYWSIGQAELCRDAGNSKSLNTRIKISIAKKGTKLSPETRAMLSAMRKGIKKSTEHKAKISASWIGKKLSPEHIAKSVEAKKRNRAARMLLNENTTMPQTQQTGTEPLLALTPQG